MGWGGGEGEVGKRGQRTYHSLAPMMFVSVSLCLSLSLSVTLSVSVIVSVFVTLSVSVTVSVCHCLCLCLSVSLYVSVSICLSLSVSLSCVWFGNAHLSMQKCSSWGGPVRDPDGTLEIQELTN